jgi:thiol-disulfide isomerase/thioredoxin
MNRRFFLQSLFCSAGVMGTAAYCFSSQSGSDGLAAGQTLLGQSYPDLQGQSQPLAQWQGRPLVVNFWATWCAPCRQELPLLNAASQLYKNVQFLGLGVDNADNIRKFMRNLPVSYPMLVMGIDHSIELLKRLGNSAAGLPFTAILDKDGSIRQRVMGIFRENQLASWLQAL